MDIRMNSRASAVRAGRAANCSSTHDATRRSTPDRTTYLYATHLVAPCAFCNVCKSLSSCPDGRLSLLDTITDIRIYFSRRSHLLRAQGERRTMPAKPNLTEPFIETREEEIYEEDLLLGNDGP